MKKLLWVWRVSEEEKEIMGRGYCSLGREKGHKIARKALDNGVSE